MSTPVRVMACPPSLWTTYSGPSSPSAMRSVPRPWLNLPFWSSTPVRNISEMASIIPEPQMPVGGTSPITEISAS